MPPPVPMLNIGAPGTPGVPVPLGIAKGPPVGAAAVAAPPVNENAEATGLPAAFAPAEKLNAAGGDEAVAPKIPEPAADGAGAG